jgi:cytochrome c peroxidase
MTKKLIVASVAVLGMFACKQEFTPTDTASISPNQAELAKSYHYSDVHVQKGFERFANLLTVEDPTSTSLFSFSTSLLKEGDVVKIIGVTDAKAKLGRVLFYDKQLSINNAVACGSCHHQSQGFADGGEALSKGHQEGLTTRNSMSIVNPGMVRSGMFWDRRESSVRTMSLNPVQNHIEMGMENLSFLEAKLSKIDYYAPLFQEAYGTTKVTSNNISDAMTAFLRSMVSWDSKFDQGVKNKFANFTSEEKQGMDLFMGKATDVTGTGISFGTVATGACNNCHSAPMFNDGNTVNAYYDVDFFAGLTGGGIDIGLDKQSKDPGAKNGGFKIPTLRNVELTGPYMHDGRFKSLEEVIDHYSEGIKASPNLSSRLKETNGSPKKFNFTPSEKKALVAFMKTLTDRTFVSDTKYSNPFAN